MGLRQELHTLSVHTTGKGFVEINRQLAHWLGEISAQDGLLTLFIRHTSASLTMSRKMPTRPCSLTLPTVSESHWLPERPDYRHSSEGPDDMPSHIKSMLTQSNLDHSG